MLLLFLQTWWNNSVHNWNTDGLSEDHVITGKSPGHKGFSKENTKPLVLNTLYETQMYGIHSVWHQWCFVSYSTNNIMTIQPTPDQPNADRETNF